MTSTAKKQALGSLRILIAAKLVVVLIVAGMLWYMVGRPTMYPVWTLGLMGLVEAYSLFSLVRDLRA